MNLQSNALKFTRNEGPINIIAELIIAKCKGIIPNIYRYRNIFKEECKESDSENSYISGQSIFDKEHGIYQIY